MNVVVSHVQGCVPITVFSIKERINLGNVEALEQIARQTYQNGARDLLLELTEVPFITSAGLRTMHIIYRLFDDQPSEERGSTGARRAISSW